MGSRTDPPPPAGRQLVSDAERDAAVARLRIAAQEGRLTVDELADRTEGALAARTAADLADATSGLPVPAAAAPPALAGEPYGGGAVAGAVALTLLPPGGRLVALVVALALLRTETSPARRAQLRTWAAVAGVLLAIEAVIAALLLFG